MQENCPLWFNYLSLQIFEWFQQRRCVAHEARMWTLCPRTERFPAMCEYLSAWTGVQLGRDGGRRERGVRVSPPPPAPEPVIVFTARIFCVHIRVPRPRGRTSSCPSLCPQHPAPGRGGCYLHFTQGETEAQTDEVTCSEQAIPQWQSWDSNRDQAGRSEEVCLQIPTSLCLITPNNRQESRTGLLFIQLIESLFSINSFGDLH